MSKTKIISFKEAIEATEEKNRTLLLGNGFSIKFFSYDDLLIASGIEEGTSLRELFSILDTKDFEHVIRSLEDAALVADAYDDKDMASNFKSDANQLRKGLIHAINETHPEYNEIDDIIPSCEAFISNFKKIFTLNYDLLLYWVRLNIPQFHDGFGKGIRNNGFIGPFTKGAYCEIYNLHGGLHLFKNNLNEIEKRLASGDDLISRITETIEESRLPLYVAEGTSKKKLAKINSVPYLRHCLEELGNITGTLFIYGHSASENDKHIYKAIFESKVLQKVYFCIHRPTTNVNKIKGVLENYKSDPLANDKIKIEFIDAESVKVWDVDIANEKEEE